MLNDSPITAAEQDLYGVAPLARAIAAGVVSMTAPEGFVMAVSGPFGSGKSSVINLVCAEMSALQRDERPYVVRFTPWWFGAGAEGLTRGFFTELATALEGGLRGKVRRRAGDALGALWQRVRPVRQIAGVAVDVASGGVPIGSGVVAGADAAIDLLGGKRPVEEEFERLASALRGQNRRFLVVIDEMDRLDPEEMVQVFRLVKSVGRLPNVIYLLGYDRDVADRHLQRLLGTTASEYLEKIVQRAFELPAPGPELLSEALLAGLAEFVELPTDGETSIRFGNTLHDMVMPWLTKPRNVVSLLNAMRLAWPVVADDVDLADFLGLEALRLAHPTVYRAVQANPARLCGREYPSMHVRKADVVSIYDATLLADANEAERPRIQVALRRLFPRLDAIWGNTYHGDESGVWHRARRVCSRPHFDAYFRFAPGGAALPGPVVRELRSHVTDAAYLREHLTRGMQVLLPDGRRRAALLLEELRLMIVELDEREVASLCLTLADMSGELEGEYEMQPFAGSVSEFDLLRVAVAACIQRVPEGEARAALAEQAMARGSALWQADLSHHFSRYWDVDPTRRGDDRRMDEGAARQLDNLALEAIRAAARNGDLISRPRLLWLLFRWAHLAGDKGRQARSWTSARLDEGAAIPFLASAVVGTVWTQGIAIAGDLGDRVATRGWRVHSGIDHLIDLDRLEQRCRDVLAKGDIPQSDRDVLVRFIEARSQTGEGD